MFPPTLSLRGAGPKTKSKKTGSTKAPKEKTSTKKEAPKESNGLLPPDSTPVVTGLLESHPGSRDIKIGKFSLEMFGKMLVEDTQIELNYGRRYGLLGSNGVGKSTLLRILAARLVPIPAHIDVFLLSEEARPSDLNAMQFVIKAVQDEVARLEAKSEALLEKLGPDSEELQEVYERLDALDPATFEKRAGELLHGLGFDKARLAVPTKSLSGGWRMRVALAEALFIKPHLLLLDEPTNHLDLGSCVWLEDQLSRYEKILLLTSHSQDFLNGVCTNMMVLRQKQLSYWTGNYDTYMKTRTEQETNQMKQYEKQQEEIRHTKAFIASCGTYANLVRQGKSRQKQLDKMLANELVLPVQQDKKISLRFPDCGKLTTPVFSLADVSFSYSGKPEDYLYHAINLGFDSDSRIALVGPNGAGKSTLIKLIAGELLPSEGSVAKRPGCRVGRFSQHSTDQLDPDLTPLEYIQKRFPEKFKNTEDARTAVGKLGLTGDMQVQPIRKLSDGLKSRLVFTEMMLAGPHMLLLDEPTNHLDMESIDALADAIKEYEGGLILVSHDFRLIEQVAQEIWVVDRGVTTWPGTIREYKEALRKEMAARLEV